MRTRLYAAECHASLNEDVTDQQLMDADIRDHLAAGNLQVAFERLVERYAQKVFHLAISLLRNETQAEDMAQEILLRIWKGLPSYQGQASLSTWIYTISRNTCFTELRKRAARPTVSINEPDFAESFERLPALQSCDPEPGLEADIGRMLDELPEKYRQVVTLFYLEQKSYEEVGTLLGIPLGTVKTFLFRAKKQLLQISRRREPALLQV